MSQSFLLLTKFVRGMFSWSV